ncbi:hypothetical protein BC831DRAFT_451846 [Entophlyctis helioformis]|nr:hypothetical protein BC831DRAFT_451846 [Entophlyctis helioformis]
MQPVSMSMSASASASASSLSSTTSFTHAVDGMSLNTTLTTLPSVPLQGILELLPPLALLRLSATCRQLRAAAVDELLWKELCLLHWPWFFYSTRGCERTLNNSIEPSLTCSCWRLRPHGKRSVGSQIDAQLFAGNGNPYQPLPSSYRRSYALIASGRWTGLIDVLDSLTDRPMSAFMALATYDPPSKSFCVSYNKDLIARYRRGERIQLVTPEFAAIRAAAKEAARQRRSLQSSQGMPQAKRSRLSFEHDSDRDEQEAFDDEYNSSNDLCVPTSTWISEMFPVSDPFRFRRVPARLLEQDPREIFSQEVLSMPHTIDGRPCFNLGDEVEIQWRNSNHTAFGFWRGFVSQMYVHTHDLVIYSNATNGAALITQAVDARSAAASAASSTASTSPASAGTSPSLASAPTPSAAHRPSTSNEPGITRARMVSASSSDPASAQPPAIIELDARVYSTTNIPNVPFFGDLEGIRVTFPQYDVDSGWHSVIISPHGLMLPNPPDSGVHGFVGGIRKVECETQSKIWAGLYARTTL